MNSSPEINEIATALCKAQAEMGAAEKGAENPFLKTSYADLASVIAAIKEPFAKHGLSYVQCPELRDEGVLVATSLLHSSGQFITSELIVPMAKRDPQALGAAITYGRRYALQSMAGVPALDHDAEPAMDRPATISPEQVATIRDKSKALDIIESKFCKAFGIDRIEDLPESQFHRAMTMIERRREQRGQ